MPKMSSLKFNNYTVTKIAFSNRIDKVNEENFELKPLFRRRIAKISDTEYNVGLDFTIGNEADEMTPFSIEVSMIGHFELNSEELSEELKNDLLNKNAVAILFPFLRSIIASITTSANIPPLILPVINLADNIK